MNAEDEESLHSEAKERSSPSAHVVYEAILSDRPGGDCGTGDGARVRGAILVRNGEIAAWYRLPDNDTGQKPLGQQPDGPTI